MLDDHVDTLIQQWATELPRMDTNALAAVVRIQRLAKLLQRRTTQALAKHGLKPWEYDVLSVLRRQGAPFQMAATDIAHSALLSTGAMTNRIDRLESRGLVRRRASKMDGRSVIVQLSLKGKKEIDAALNTRLEDVNLALEGLPGTSRKELNQSLRQVLAILENN